MNRKSIDKRLTIFVIVAMTLTVLSGCIGGGETSSTTISAPTTPAELVILDIIVDEKIVTNEKFDIKIKTKNTGDIEGEFTIDLKIDNIAQNKIVILGPKEEKEIIFSLSIEEPGNYEINVDGIKKEITVLKPAELKVVDIETSEDHNEVDTSIDIGVLVENSGGLSYSGELELKVGNESFKKNLTLGPNESKKTIFSYISSKPGKFLVKCGDVTKEMIIYQDVTKVFHIEQELHSIKFTVKFSYRLPFEIGKKERIQVEVQNNGGAPIWEIKIYIDDEDLRNKIGVSDLEFLERLDHGDSEIRGWFLTFEGIPERDFNIPMYLFYRAGSGSGGLVTFMIPEQWQIPVVLIE
ncbi:hypothetical protein DRN50_02290 [Thermococci archaeon]|nr:MAG: hypothetical protein DRN50_02290 [Thermococci archaeon]